jgi:hypothetical protein
LKPLPEVPELRRVLLSPDMLIKPSGWDYVQRAWVILWK